MFCCVWEGARLFQSTHVSLWRAYLRLCEGLTTHHQITQIKILITQNEHLKSKITYKKILELS